jgi:hypothetical protein
MLQEMPSDRMLCGVCCGRPGLSSSEAADSIMSSVRQWSAKQDDDLIVLVCNYIGDGPISTGGVQLDT